MSLVTPQQLKAYMSGIRMNATQTESAQVILDGVQAELEMHINRALEPRMIRESVKTDGSGVAVLTYSPVSSVRSLTAVTQGTLPYQGESHVWAPGEYPEYDGPIFDLVPENFGRDLIVPGGIFLGTIGTYYVIEYTTGDDNFLTPHLPAIRLAILRVASREFQQMHDDTMTLRNTEAGTPAVDPIPVGRRGWKEEELTKFDRIRRRVVF